MRKLFAVALVGVLLPAALAAQKVPPVKNAPGQVMDVKGQVMDVKGAPVQQAQAQAAALAQVRTALAAGKLTSWRSTGGAIRGSSVTAAGAVFKPTGGPNGTPVWLVGVKAPNAKGHVRVAIDAKTGAAVGGLVADTLDWGSAPASH